MSLASEHSAFLRRSFEEAKTCVTGETVVVVIGGLAVIALIVVLSWLFFGDPYMRIARI